MTRTPVSTDARARMLAGDLPLQNRRQGVIDTAARMASGLFIHVVLWCLLVLVDGYVARHRVFVVANAVGLLSISCLRWAYHRRLGEMLDRDYGRGVLVFRALVVAHNLYWGVLCALVASASDAPNLKWLIVMCASAIAVGGTAIVALDSLFSVVYPLATLGPTAIAMLYVATPASLAAVGLSLVLFIYAFSVSRLVGNDYWGRQHALYSLQQRAQELARISRTDALTQVANRLHFQDHLEQVWRDARRRQEALAVCIVDLDHFKRINDAHGHPFGDRCLQAAARVLSGAVRRPGDLLARYGGEEFVVVLHNTDLRGAALVAGRMLNAVHATVIEHDAHRIELRCSIGVAAHVPARHDQADQVDHLIQAADAALYQAKEHGRGRVVCQGE